MGEVMKLVPQERIPVCIAEEIVDVPVSTGDGGNERSREANSTGSGAGLGMHRGRFRATAHTEK